MRTYCITQRALLNAPEQKGSPKGKGHIYYTWLIHSAVQQKQIQHGKATILQ